MKPRQTLGLVALLLVLCAVYYGQQFYRGQQQEAARVARKVFDFVPEDLRMFSIDRMDGPACVAERDADGAWRIREPNPTIRPFQLMWERAAAHLAGLLNEHTVLAQPTDLGQYGLDVPALVVSGETADGGAFRLEFGDLEPTQRNRYARLNKGDLFLVHADAFFELNRTLTELRHRFLVDDREAAPVEIEFAWIWTGTDEQKEGQPEIGDESILIHVKRDGPDAPWRMIAPEPAPANHGAVQSLSDDLQFAVCKDFIDNPEDLADYGLNPPRARISLKTEGAETLQTLWLGAPDESPDHKGVFARREGEDAVIVIDPHLVSLLPRTPLEWRDRRLLTRRVSEINRLEYATEFDRFVLERGKGDEWRLAEPVMEHVNELAVSGFLSFFKDIEGDTFVDDVDKATAFAAPAARIVLRYDDASTAEILIAATENPEEGALAMQDSGGVVRLSQAATRMLLTDSENFRSREILRFVKGDVEALRFVFEESEYKIVRRHDRWVLLAPESLQLHNQSDVTTLMDAVCPLFTTGAVITTAPEDPAVFGLDAPVFDLTITPGGDAPEMTLRIGAPNPVNPDERYAQTSTRTGVYRISQEVMDTIREALRGIH